MNQLLELSLHPSLLNFSLEMPNKLSRCHLVCIGIRWLQPWLRGVEVYQGLRAQGTVCGCLGDRVAQEFGNVTSLAGVGDLGVRASITDAVDLGAGKLLENNLKISRIFL